MPGAIKDRPWIVQKYGGTSLGKLLETITITIVPQYLKENNIAVVCSAISGTTKSMGTTSLLLRAIDSAMAGSLDNLEATISTIQDQHVKASKEIRISVNSIHQSQICDELEVDIIKECDELRAFLIAAQTIGELSPRSKDRILATGEKLACLLVVTSLLVKGIHAQVVSLIDIVSEVYTSDYSVQKSAYDNLGPQFFDGLAEEIGLKLEACRDSVPVITGFFGMMPYSMIQSVGRGYSDFCASMCASGLLAAELQIWKEVDGIFTADPKKVPSARLLETITLEEATELTYYGSEVIHPLTMQQIRRANIPLRLKNVKNPGGRGTIIYPSSSSPDSSPTQTPFSTKSLSSSVPSFMAANGYYGELQYRKTPTALTSKDSILLVNIQSDGQLKSHGFLSHVFQALDRLNVVADLITTSEQSISLAIPAIDNLAQISQLSSNLGKLGKVEILKEMAIISVIGHRMRNMVGIAGEVFSKLAEAGVNIYLISQGASEINISCVVRASDALLALEIVHLNVLRIPQHTKHITTNGSSSLMQGPWLF